MYFRDFHVFIEVTMELCSVIDVGLSELSDGSLVEVSLDLGLRPDADLQTFQARSIQGVVILAQGIAEVVVECDEYYVSPRDLLRRQTMYRCGIKGERV